MGKGTVTNTSRPPRSDGVIEPRARVDAESGKAPSAALDLESPHPLPGFPPRQEKAAAAGRCPSWWAALCRASLGFFRLQKYLFVSFFVNSVSLGRKATIRLKASQEALSQQRKKKRQKCSFWRGITNRRAGPSAAGSPHPSKPLSHGRCHPPPGWRQPGDHHTDRPQAESLLRLRWDLLLVATRGVSHLQKSPAVGAGARWERGVLCFLISHRSSHLLHSRVPRSLAWFPLKRMLRVSRLKQIAQQTQPGVEKH